MSSENLDLKEDFLEVDSKIPGQNYCCLSFISPDELIKNKDKFKAQKFLKYILGSSLEDENEERVRQTFIENINKNLNNDTSFSKTYDTWLFSREKELEDQYNETVDFQTSTRGVKVRGVYDTLREAQVRAKVLQRRDKNFNVFVGQVGYWLPWDPSAEDIKDQEYQEDQLNQLMKKYNENADEKEDFYEQEKQEKIKKAREENRKKNKTDKSEFELNKSEDKENIEKMRTIVDKSRGYTTSEKDINKISNEFKTLTEEDPWLKRQKEGKQPEEKKVMTIEEDTPSPSFT
jgi:heterodisulfide reductase subunit C